jgi:hypothetical protein
MTAMEQIWAQLSRNVKVNSKVELVQTGNAGRGLVATEDIQTGDEILAETPFLVGPPQTIGRHFCVHCSQPLTMGLLQGITALTTVMY